MKTLIIFTLCLLMGAVALSGQSNLPYQKPHEDILKLVNVDLPPSISINYDGTKAILMYRKQFKTLEDLYEKEMRLGGLRINPVTNISSRARYNYDIKIFDPVKKEILDIVGMPDDARISNISWSNAQDKVAFTNTTRKGVELWVIDYNSQKAMQLTADDLNANGGRPYTWLADDSGFIVRRLPEERPDIIDTENAIPTGPVISENMEGQMAQNRTYQDLLRNADDEANFETLMTSELYRVTMSGFSTLWREAGMYTSISPSPDGEYMLIASIKRPFSYIVPYSRFPTDYVIYDKNGRLIKVMAEVPLTEELPKGFMAVREGPRSFSWRDDKPATLTWAVALDGGDPAQEVDYRDEVYELDAPFNGVDKLLCSTQLRYYGMTWGNDDLAIVNEYWWNTRTIRTSFINPSDLSQPPVVFSERNYQDRYNDPGSFVTQRNEFGNNVLDLSDGDRLLLMGDGYSAEGKFPFIDEYDLNTQEKKRLYRASDEDKVESLVKIIDRKAGKVLTRLESSNMFPNYYMRNIKTNTVEPITDFENPYEVIADVHKEVINYKREDGLDLSATLYLPVGYDPSSGEKLPMLMWAYPREYKDKSSAGQVTSSSNDFTYPYYGSPIYWVNRGYIVLDNAAFPIIGEGDDEPNDSFIDQLVSNAKAAIDAVDAMGYVDRSKVAVGGHSYGAFMTANLLSHSDLFAAGIARSGAYNRTLTPFGFQSEERNYWEAPEVYYEMSPFMHAEKMKTPLLLIHGDADNNSGTYPMQSERYFNALKGLGAPVRLVMLPRESHGYAAEESIFHMLWEQDQWLENHLREKSDEQVKENK